jgi:putative FmdB family regulatory protein
MPIYEYRCGACGRRSSVFVRNITSTARPSCEHCGSRKMSRLVSRFAVHGSGRVDLDDPSSMPDEHDPRAMARWARQMSEEMGEDMGPEFDEMVGRMEAGEAPDDLTGGAFDDDDDF